MILTFLFAFIIFASLLPYLSFMGVLNFKKPENAMEEHLPGRPARRTIGRKNEDMMKVIVGIIISYIILCGAFYATPAIRDYVSDVAMIVAVVGLSAFALYIVTPYNRLSHAYATTGQISVIHMCCSLSAFITWTAFLHNNYLALEDIIKLSGLIVGAMLIMSKKPGGEIKAMWDIASLSFFSLLPLIGAVCVLFLVMFGHINFKSFNIKKVQLFTAILGGIFGFVYFTSMYRLNVEFNIAISTIHFLMAILMFFLAILLGLYTRRLGPNFTQTIGLVLFFGSAFFLLA